MRSFPTLLQPLRLLRSLTAACTLALFISGCQSPGVDGLTASKAPAEISGPAASAIAGDMVSRLAEQIGPRNRDRLVEAGQFALRASARGSPEGLGLCRRDRPEDG
nr:hypothetical protein K4M19_00357 [Agrobacterium fabrum]